MMFQLGTILASLSIFLPPVLGAPSSFGQSLEERQVNYGTATWYDPGLGACGVESGEYDQILAISWEIYDTGEYCFQNITFTNTDMDTGNSASSWGIVVDKCMGCGPNDLDLSYGLFTQIGDPDAGRLPISWYYAY